MDRQLISAQETIKAISIKGGLVVNVGNGDGMVTADFFVNDHYVVHGLCAMRRNVDEAREYIKQKNLYGCYHKRTAIG